MPTKAALRSRIIRALTRSGLGSNEKDDIDGYIQSIIREDLCGDHAWGFMQRITTLPIVEGVREYGAPEIASDLFRDINFIEIGDNVSGSTWLSLEETELQTLYEAFPDEENTNEPEVWSMYQGDRILLGPIPDSPYVLRIHYWEYPEELDEDGSNFLTKHYPNLILYGVCSRALGYYGDTTKSSFYENIFQAEKARIIAADKVIRAPANRVLKISLAAGQRRIGSGRRRNRQNTGSYSGIDGS